MLVQLTLLFKLRVAYVALKWLFSGVNPEMIFDVAFLREHLEAQRAMKECVHSLSLPIVAFAFEDPTPVDQTGTRRRILNNSSRLLPAFFLFAAPIILNLGILIIN